MIRTMSQSLSAVYLHLVFSTKERQPFLSDADVRNQVHAYLGGILKELGCMPVLAGGVEDHVHLLASQSRTISQADWVKELKRASSLWLKKQGWPFRDFAWQAGYGVFSVSVSNVEVVREYIARQEEHHRKATFQNEYRAMLKKHGVAWDEKYVWH
jgi:REP element-mobilizing transposase RayT